MRRAWIVLLAAAMSLLMGRSAVAVTERLATSGEDVLVELVDPGVEWVSGGWIDSVRGWTGRYRTTDALYGEGSLLIVGNWNLDLRTGNGALWGTMYYEFPTAGGGFAGTWNAKFSAFVWSGKSQGTGFGDLAGWHLRQDIQATGPTGDVYSGFVFNPGG
ncbi:MAG TPA: hypothetical protein VFZ96_03140 [Actinomycetota bacterium]|nr:hypothetical protein [Actinomycetota bacterium]